MVYEMVPYGANNSSVLWIILNPRKKKQRFPQELVTFNDEQKKQALLGDQYILLPWALELERSLVTFVSGFLTLELC